MCESNATDVPQKEDSGQDQDTDIPVGTVFLGLKCMSLDLEVLEEWEAMKAEK